MAPATSKEALTEAKSKVPAASKAASRFQTVSMDLEATMASEIVIVQVTTWMVIL